MRALNIRNNHTISNRLAAIPKSEKGREQAGKTDPDRS